MNCSGPPAAAYLGTSLKVAGRWLRAAVAQRLERGAMGQLPAPERIGQIETLPRPAVLHEPAQLDRIRAGGFGIDLGPEIAALESTRFTGSPPERYELGDSIVVGGTIFTARARHILSSRPVLKGLGIAPTMHDRATLLNSQQGLYYFGHWLQDDCALYEAVRDAPTLLSMMRPAWPDRHVYERAFAQSWPETDFAHVADLTLWRDLGYSTDKARRLRLLRQRLRQAVPARGTGKIVYVSRGKLGERRSMSNAADFEAALEKAGITVIEPGIGSEAMVSALLGAELVIAIEGSQACHGLYTLADGGAFLILQPPDRFYNPLRNWAALLDMRYGIVVGEKDETGFHIHPDEVLRMVDRLRAG